MKYVTLSGNSKDENIMGAILRSCEMDAKAAIMGAFYATGLLKNNASIFKPHMLSSHTNDAGDMLTWISNAGECLC